MTLSQDTLQALHEAATRGPWETDHEPDDEFRYHNYFIGADVGGKWHTLLDTVNSDHKLIEDDRDEDGGSAWDAIGKANAELVTYLRNAVPEILTLIAERDAMRLEVDRLEQDNAFFSEAVLDFHKVCNANRRGDDIHITGKVTAAFNRLYAHVANRARAALGGNHHGSCRTAGAGRAGGGPWRAEIE